MPALRAPLLLAVLALGLAGCAGPDGAPAPDAPASDADAAPAAAAPDASPPPMDAGHLPHMHDYWEGRERVTLFDDEVDPGANDDPFMPLYGVPSGRLGGTLWRFPDGAIVMEGTGEMQITATWDDPRVTSLAAAYRPAPSEDFREPVTLPPGETVAIRIEPAMTDMPHQTTSRWELVFFPADAPGALMAPFALRVDIVKMRDIGEFPGHPELFGGLPEKVIHDAAHEHTEQSYAARAPQLLTEGGFQEKFVAPAQLVPMETQAMRIELDILETSATPGQVADIRFFYRGADTSYIGHPTVLPLEGGFDERRLVYQVPVRPEETDTPYGETSQWLFFVEPATKFTGHEAEPDCGGCADVSISYRLKVIVYDHPLETYSKRADQEG